MHDFYPAGDGWRPAPAHRAGRPLHRTEHLALWATLPTDSQVEEEMRNCFIRQPVL